MLMGIFRRIGFTTLAILTLAPAALRADTFLVTRFVDKNDGACDRDCSLREAVLAANQHPGFDAILLPPGTYRLSVAGADEDQGATGDLDVNDDLQIVGLDPASTIVDGGGIDRVFEIRADVRLAGVTVRHGVSQGGGGIRNNNGRLTLYESIVTGNSAPDFGFGAGIYSDGFDSSLTLSGSTISGNTAEGGGGGIAAGGLVKIADSTVSGNRSVNDFGGGVYLFTEARTSFNNVTITLNRAAQSGGGLYVETPDDPNSPRIANSIIAGNSGPRDPDCRGSNISGGYNLVGEGEGCPGFSAARNDQTGSVASPLDPRLAPLADNGGPTPTHALLPDSPAVNTGNPAPPGSGNGACEMVDQRLFPRRFTRCDIGAFERKAGR